MADPAANSSVIEASLRRRMDAQLASRLAACAFATLAPLSAGLEPSALPIEAVVADGYCIICPHMALK